MWKIHTGPVDRGWQKYGWVGKKICLRFDKEFETAAGLMAAGLHLSGFLGHVAFFQFKENSQHLVISVPISSHTGNLC